MSEAARLAGRVDPARIVDIDIFGDDLRQRALRGLCAEWATCAPFYVLDAGMPQAVVSRYAEVEEVFLDRSRFTSKAPRLPGYERVDLFGGLTSVSQMDGAEHARVRNALAPSFGPAVLAKADEAIRHIVDTMLDEVAARGDAFDCMQDFASHLIVRVLLDGLLTLSPEQQRTFVTMHDMLPLLQTLTPGEAPPAAYLRAQDDAFRVMAQMVEERRAVPRPLDFVSALVARHDDTDRLSDDELVANIFGICAAALGTTATTTTAMLMNLCKHREQFDQVIADPGLIAQTVDECLRYQASGCFSFPRFALHDCEIGGVPIYRGMPVHICQQAANLDPAKYPDPLTLDIHRRPKGVLTFGTGIHHCIGHRLAKQIIATVLERVCSRFPGLRLQDADFVPRYEGMLGELKPVSVPMDLGRR